MPRKPRTPATATATATATAPAPAPAPAPATVTVCDEKIIAALKGVAKSATALALAVNTAIDQGRASEALAAFQAATLSGYISAGTSRQYAANVEIAQKLGVPWSPRLHSRSVQNAALKQQGKPALPAPTRGPKPKAEKAESIEDAPILNVLIGVLARLRAQKLDSCAACIVDGIHELDPDWREPKR